MIYILNDASLSKINKQKLVAAYAELREEHYNTVDMLTRHLEGERAKCPGCGIPTVPDHGELTDGDKLCLFCAQELGENSARVNA